MKQTKHYNGFSWRFQDVCILRRIWVVCVKAHSTKTNFEGFQNKNKFSWKSFESFGILLKFVNASLKFFFQISFPKREEHLSRLSKTSISGQKTTFIFLSKTMVSRPKKALISRENPSCNAQFVSYHHTEIRSAILYTIIHPPPRAKDWKTLHYRGNSPPS